MSGTKTIPLTDKMREAVSQRTDNKNEKQNLVDLEMERVFGGSESVPTLVSER